MNSTCPSSPIHLLGLYYAPPFLPLQETFINMKQSSNCLTRVTKFHSDSSAIKVLIQNAISTRVGRLGQSKHVLYSTFGLIRLNIYFIVLNCLNCPISHITVSNHIFSTFIALNLVVFYCLF